MKNKVALITNATKYAGPGAVSALFAKGYKLMCHDELFINNEIKNNFTSLYPEIAISAEKNPSVLVNKTLREFGKIDILVSNDVYPLQYLLIDEACSDDFRETLEALLIWPFSILSKVTKKMKEQKSGNIIFITSAAPKQPEPGFSIYSSARAAASALAVAAARELAEFNITVNAIAPNYLESNTYYSNELSLTENFQKKLKQSVPVGRLGKIEEIGALIAFLASGSANFITGEVICFTGGWP